MRAEIEYHQHFLTLSELLLCLSSLTQGCDGIGGKPVSAMRVKWEANMSHESAGSNGRTTDVNTGKFGPGMNAYQRRKLAKEAIKTALLVEYDFSGASAAIMLPIVVGFLFDSTRARSKEDRVRCGNSARRILRDIPRKRPETATRTLPQVLAHE